MSTWKTLPLVGAALFLVVALNAVPLSRAQTAAARGKPLAVGEYFGPQSQHYLELRRFVQDTSSLHVGMTRGELEKTFHMETGFTQGETWVYNHCPYIRLRATFGSNPLVFPPNPTDKVLTLGNPYWVNENESPN